MAFKELAGLFRDSEAGRKNPIEKEMGKDEVFYKCTVCNYERGFHVAYKLDGLVHALICPSCGQWFVIKK